MVEKNTSNSSASQEVERPVGRDEVIEAAVSAAADLFAKNNPSQVSVREIARRAGVSHALVHRYLGTKDDIFRAVVDAERARAIAIWTGADNLIDAPALFDGDGQPTRYLSILFRAHLEGMDVTGDAEPVVSHLLTLLKTYPLPKNGEVEVDLRVAVLAAIAATASMSIAHTFFSDAVGLQGMSRTEFHAQYQRLMLHVLSLGSV